MKRLPSTMTLAMLTFLSGCSSINSTQTLKQQTADELRSQMALSSLPKQPVVSSSAGAWLAGASVQLAEPLHPALQQQFAYHPTQAVSLAEVAAWVMQKTGVPVDISELQQAQNGQMSTPGATPGQSPLGVFGLQSMPGMNGLNSLGMQPNRESLWSMHINHEGSLAGLLDVAANKAGAWWRMSNGRVVFYKTLSKTFYLPVVARKFSASSLISTASGAAGGSSGSAGGQSSSLAATSGTTADSNYSIDLWTDIEKTAKTVGGGAQIAANPAGGSLTVTGTPAQVRQVEEWIKNLGEQLSQQVAVTIRIYSVKVTREDSYNWNPSVIFRSVGGVGAATLTGPSTPAIASGMTAANLGLGISSPGNAYDGSKAAVQALSTLGETTEVSNQTIITLNGQPVPLQQANTQGYVQSVSTTTTTNAGTTSSITPGTVTAGLTGVFIPRIANGKVILGMTLTRSTNNGFQTVSTGSMSIQTPNVDSDAFQQSVSLTQGEALMLTGLSKEAGNTNKSGVGSPNNPLFGGGISNSRGQTLTGIVITARIL